MNIAPTAAYWTSGEMKGRYANQADGVLTVFQNHEIVTCVQLSGNETPAEIWSLIHNARTFAPVETSERTAQESDYLSGTRIQRHTRSINGNAYDFSRITWASGEVTIKVFRANTTDLIHCFS